MMSEWRRAEKKGRERRSEVCNKAWGRRGDAAHLGLDASPHHWSIGGAVYPGHMLLGDSVEVGQVGRNVCPSYRQDVCKSGAPNSEDA